MVVWVPDGSVGGGESNTITPPVGTAVGVAVWAVPQLSHPFPPPDGCVGVGVVWPPFCPLKMFWVSITTVSGVIVTVGVGASVLKNEVVTAPIGCPLFTSSGG